VNGRRSRDARPGHAYTRALRGLLSFPSLSPTTRAGPDYENGLASSLAAVSIHRVTKEERNNDGLSVLPPFLFLRPGPPRGVMIR